MARLWTCNFGLNSLTAGVEKSSAFADSGTVSISSAQVHSGTTSLRINPSAAAGFITHEFYSGTNKTSFIRFYYYVTTHLASTQQLILVASASGTTIMRLRGTGSGIRLMTAPNTQVGSDVALNTGQWYRIEVKIFSNATTGTLDLLVDGVNQATGTGLNTSGVDIGVIRFGTNSVATHDVYIGDVAINDSTGGSQNSYPGAGNTVYCQPNGAGDSNQWTVQIGGTAGSSNNYTRVNEAFPPDDVTTYNGELISGDIDLFTIGGLTAIGSGDTINVVHVGCRYRAVVAAAEAAFKLDLESAASGTKTQSAEITPNSTTWKTNANADPITYPITSYTDPTTGVAWTTTGTNSLTNAQIGYEISTQNTNAADISTVWMVVDYTPVAAAAAGGSTLMMMGVG